ncbi:PTS sugar transporter subunit IID [Alkalihalobacillus alcalophilus ATCC 27647 = CGMCC 1.3604]|uniref:PTS sugar transporter subunit IIC n=1 Tax=Alkalihalobacillus alcalophilus ATCC 27647 = CGMCC 1.3604 TaxID=1218173 RepID=A0A094WM03_ALKAL|nr:PTS sugar transporter subunit IIC [Alkalihalobacillus alcalophilus]KGA98749.1 PTS sugar transporter subunit IIC [Alkalihalobacillus alcalophilus ATCC 27647 = CGMCC 1.3604]MED1562657.1 PTS sugar transporter subunit IIC [Alkalihalobacillus alcalophilus]THG89402.1 PTS sugar transporter subunit IID [Alkalihalobacillus alcalophilus ATCC 27647 = CGMCC 1.3604]
MKSFLAKKEIKLSWNNYLINAMSHMALGLFASLIIGLIIKTMAEQLQNLFGEYTLFLFLEELGVLTMGLMGPAIGVAVAFSLKAPKLVLFAAVVSGAAGATLGGPAGSFIAAVISTELGKLVSGETKLDIIVTPFVTVLSGFVTASFVGPWIQTGLQSIGSLIIWATEQQPLLMGVLVATIMGLALTAPISSAALAIMLELEGLAAGAATVGCAAQMVGFAVSSYRENRWSGLISLGIGTSMLQMPNIIKNPYILIPPTAAGIILAPISTLLVGLINNPAGAGMGTSGFVGPIMIFTEMGFTLETLIIIILLLIVAPAIISLILSEWLRKIGKIQYGDMKINQS